MKNHVEIDSVSKDRELSFYLSLQRNACYKLGGESKSKGVTGNKTYAAKLCQSVLRADSAGFGGEIE